MDTAPANTENGKKTEYNTHRVGIRPGIEVSNYIPDYIQKTIIDGMDKIEEEILKHQEAIRSLEALYTSHANFLKRYSPFDPDGDLSQISLSTGIKSPEALPPAERGTDG